MCKRPASEKMRCRLYFFANKKITEIALAISVILLILHFETICGFFAKISLS